MRVFVRQLGDGCGLPAPVVMQPSEYTSFTLNGHCVPDGQYVKSAFASTSALSPGSSSTSGERCVGLCTLASGFVSTVSVSVISLLPVFFTERRTNPENARQSVIAMGLELSQYILDWVSLEPDRNPGENERSATAAMPTRSITASRMTISVKAWPFTELTRGRCG